MWTVIGVISLVLLCAIGQEVERPTVNIRQGSVVGTIAEDGDYFTFYGIPYADSASGVNRFKAPRPPRSFEELFVADRKDIKCVRALGQGFEGTEDCLVADVFTPSLNENVTMPVMVWIKGKEFDQRNGLPELSYKNFIEREVIVVSLNYRESVFGFLCLGNEVAPGNAGLKDIIAGLRWVKENIEQFGGDPDNISLFGHGTGAAAVDLVTLSPMANGLVNRAISQSGTAMAPWAVTRDNLEYAIQVAEALGHKVTDTAQLAQIFTRTSVTALMAVIDELDLTDNSLAFAPCVEREIENVEAFLLKSPYQIISNGEMLKIPFMTGFAEFEGTIRAEEATENNWLERMDSSFMDFLQPDLQFENDEQRNQIAENIKNFYFGDDTIDIIEYLSYQGDILIQVSAIREARLRADFSSLPVYLYEFSYKGPLGEPFQGPLGVKGAAHSEELAYLFSDPSTVSVDKDGQVSDILIERWTNFAKNGVPTTQLSTVIWMPFTATNPSILLIDDRVQNYLEILMTNPRSDEMAFWDYIYSNNFLDADGRWVINEDDEEESIEGCGEEDSEEDGDGDGEEDSNGDGNEDGEGAGDAEGDGDEDGEGDVEEDGDGDGEEDSNGDGNENGEGNGEEDGDENGEGDGEEDGEGDGGEGSDDNGDGDVDEGGDENGEGNGDGNGDDNGEEEGEEDGDGDGEGDGGESGDGNGNGDVDGDGDEHGEGDGESGEGNGSESGEITTEPAVTDRGEEDEITVTDSSENETTTSTVTDSTEGETTTDSLLIIESGEESGSEEDDGETDSASTAVGYTFLIMSLFGILSRLHGEIIIS